ncbi:thymidine kinase [Vibrio phage USC-1]|uniref:Thymidine kinase n=2 Tax=Aphroditevirus USC1 TaxID=2846605 RepID=A0A514A297_9CAUD|nr:thymidine kinase [Vibrio phage USC-1]QCW23102.1 thymidine kinase [Vibrio phage 5 TSL-2019]QDH47414.1 thymidine kinase [Vibrio phage USC-1]
MSKIYFYTSAMSSGKTTTAIQTAYNYQERGMIPFVLKPVVDTRDGCPRTLTSRSGAKWDNCIPFPKEGLGELELWLRDHERQPDVLIIDEVQFISESQIDALATLARKLGIPLLCYGLRNNFQGGGFPASDWLLRHASSINIVKGMCWCGKNATHNLMVVDGKPYYGTQGESAVVVGGNETYHAVCLPHFLDGKFKRT